MKPQSRHGYPATQRDLVRAGCVTLARLLDDEVREHVTLVGGVVPLLVVPDAAQSLDPHPGTLDLDLGVELAAPGDTLGALEVSLRRGGFVPGDREARWQYPSDVPRIWLDTIPEGSWLPEIRLAFRDRDRLTVSGPDLAGAMHTGDLWVIGPGAFLVLKALAFDRRREPKDAFDLWWLVRHLPNALNTITARLAPLMREARVRTILGDMRMHFEDDGAGPRAVAQFTSGARDDDLEADVVGLMNQLLDLVGV